MFFCAISFAANARPFPEAAVAGTLNGADAASVKIGSQVMRLAPGVRIFNQNNMIVFPASLPDSAKVLYQIDIAGFVLNLWLLSEEETSELKKAGKKF